MIIRYFIDDCVIALCESGGLSQSPAILRDFADPIIAVHREISPLDRALCNVGQVDTQAVLANRICARLEREISQRITARMIAVEYRMGRSQLDRLFRERFGVGFHRYLTAMRVKCGLNLVMSGMKVEAAAVCVGYKSKKDFYRSVREETGSTPARLRRSLAGC